MVKLPVSSIVSPLLVISKLRNRIAEDGTTDVGYMSKINCYYVPVLPQWHVKDPGHSANSVGGRLHVNKHTPLT